MSELQSLLSLLAHKWTWLPMAMGIARLVCKFWNGPLQARLTALMVGAATGPDQAEADDWEHVLRWRGYRVFAFALDLFLSIKLPTLADFLKARGELQKPRIDKN